MNLLVVGVSYRTAPVSVLEQLAVPPESLGAVLARLVTQPHIGEALVLSTCNRVEVYAAASAFHAGLADIGAALAAYAGCGYADLASHLYVHYEADAVRHAYRVAAGLDSMVVGEAQILGQLREAYTAATQADTVGRLLHELMQQALRVGKRAHSETGLDRAGASVVTAALALATGNTSTPAEAALVVGAGAMGALALATLRRAGVTQLYIANRGLERGQRLASLHGATAVPMSDISDLLTVVDLVVCATASTGHVLTLADIPADRRGAGPAPRLAIVDLGIPRDVDPAVAELGIDLVNMETLAAHPAGSVAPSAARAAEAIVDAEVEAFLFWRSAADAAPTVAALRARADEVVAQELRRLHLRQPELSDAQRSEVARTVHRVVQQLLHRPTVRVRQLAAEPGGEQYAALVRDLFDLETQATSRAVEVPDISPAPAGAATEMTL